MADPLIRRNVTIWSSSLDAQTPEPHKFKTLAGAMRYAHERVGSTPTLGSYYAVSDDGVCKVECDGCTLEELFPRSEPRVVYRKES